MERLGSHPATTWFTEQLVTKVLQDSEWQVGVLRTCPRNAHFVYLLSTRKQKSHSHGLSSLPRSSELRGSLSSTCQARAVPWSAAQKCAAGKKARLEGGSCAVNASRVKLRTLSFVLALVFLCAAGFPFNFRIYPRTGKRREYSKLVHPF